MTQFPPGCFERADDPPESECCSFDRLVTHIEPGGVAAVPALCRELQLAGEAADVCSWVSHLDPATEHVVKTGPNANEPAANQAASDVLVHDLNAHPMLPPRCSLGVDVRNPTRRLFERHGFDAVRTDGDAEVMVSADPVGRR